MIQTADGSTALRRFAVTVIQPPNHLHSRAFDEVAECLHQSLLDLGHDSLLTHETDLPGRVHFVLGSNLLDHHRMALSATSILYNLEQIWPGSPWLSKSLLRLFRRFPVIDYSLENIRQLRKLGIDDVGYLPIGFHPCLERIAHAEPDIDVLFFGYLNERRQQILDELKRRALRVEVLSNVYGQERDALIARAKIIINIHFYEHHVLEQARLAFLLANERFVLSEGGPPAEEQMFEAGIVFAPYEQLVERCEEYLSKDAERDLVAQAGKRLMGLRPQVTLVAKLLAGWGR